jgi:uncharacterized Tic20 family protein
MPASADSDPPGVTLAVTAEVLYLANLLLAPGLAFLVLVVLYRQRHATAAPLAAAHLAQTLSASLWAGVLLVVVNLGILALGGYQGVHTWVILILYFTLAHATLVVCGAVGLARALAGQCWRFPLVGRPLPPDCPHGARS